MKNKTKNRSAVVRFSALAPFSTLFVATAEVVRARAGGWRITAYCVLLASVVSSMTAFAQQRPTGPGLIGLPYANDVEAAAASANQSVFNQLEPTCNPGGVFDQNPSPPLNAPGRVGICTSQDVFAVYLNARELVHTANELQ